jgi:hypothetical protein
MTSTHDVPTPFVPSHDLQIAHAAGACDHGCGLCAEVRALTTALVRLYIARRPDVDAIEAVEDRLRALGHADAIADAAGDADQAVSR